MTNSDELKRLAKPLQDRSRKIQKVGNSYLVPRKFDDEGVPLSADTFDTVKHLKKLSLNDLRFLYEWRKNEWDVTKTKAVMNLTDEQIKRVQKKVQCFRDEEAVIQAMAQIPTPNWITSKHLTNVSDGGKLEDSQRDSLKELAKIVGAYKPTTNLTIQASLQMPELSPEQAKAAREFFDTIAVEGIRAA